MSNRQRIKRHAKDGASRGAIVPVTGHRHALAMTVSHHCAGCGREVEPPHVDDGRPRLNPEAEAIQAHIADLEERLIELAVADLRAMSLDHARAIFDHPENDAEGGAGDAASYYVYDHYAEGMDEYPTFVDRLSAALDEAMQTADVGELSCRVWDLPESHTISPESSS
jgi:hypothetical protein